nr:uncharacterized protein LOC109180761 [Ipomoea batatas]GME16013.1 uncharacterized protein LOC109180761 [Ipomoea batatas]
MHFSLLDPYEILDSIDISDLPMDDNTPLGDLPHPSTEVPSLHGDPLDVAPLQTLEPESSFSFDPPIVFIELELDIPRSIRPNTTADHVAQARELVGPDVEVLAPSPGANVTEPPGDGYIGVHVLSLSTRSQNMMSPTKQPQAGGKFAAKWEGPYIVEAVVRPGSYKLKTPKGKKVARVGWALYYLQGYLEIINVNTDEGSH